jgi:hypothetical protein
MRSHSRSNFFLMPLISSDFILSAFLLFIENIHQEETEIKQERQKERQKIQPEKRITNIE